LDFSPSGFMALYQWLALVLILWVLAIIVIACWVVDGLKSDLQKISCKFYGVICPLYVGLYRLDFSPSGFMALWPMVGISAYSLGFSLHSHCLLGG
jgi:hypothetical protein